MAPRPNITETVQIGVESTAGTAVNAGVRLGSLSIDPDYDIAGGTKKPTGYKYATMAEVTTDATALKLSGTPAWPEAVYPLSCVIGTATVTTPTNGIKTRDWTFASSTNNADTYKTLSVERGNNAIRSQNAAHGTVSGLTFNFSRLNGCTWDGDGFASRMHDDKLRYLTITATGGTFTVTVGASTTSGIAYNATNSTVQTAIAGLASVGSGNVTVTGGPGGTASYRIFFTGSLANSDTLTVTADGTSLTGTGAAATMGRMTPSPIEYTLKTIQGSMLDLYLATSYAGLAGASKFTGAFGGSIKLGNRFAPVYYLNSAQASYGDVVEDDPAGEVTLMVSAVDTGMDLVNYVRTTNKLFFRLLATGPLIESVTPDYYHLYRWDGCLFITGSPAKKAEGAVVGYEFKGTFAHDATWGQSFSCLVRTNLSALGSAEA